MPIIQIEEPINKKNDNNQIIIGIDLGTTNSAVGMVIDGQVKLFCDQKNRDLHPSIVNFNEDGDLLNIAEENITNKEKIHQIRSIKRLMGKSFNDVKKHHLLAKKYLPKIAQNCDLDQPVSLQIGKKNYSAVEISAEILKYLKKIAEKNLNKSVNKVVISVPAHFDDASKNATKQSALLAGLEVVRLINEPTASALAYGLDHKSQGYFAVYDLGGGTFDVSVLKITNGVFKVLGVAGDNHLGGDDFDHLLHDYGFENFRLAKETLSSNDFYQEGDLKITRKEFENLIYSKISTTVKICENLLEDLDLEINQLEGIILVGGSSKIPLIKKLLIEKFGERILTNIDPDRVVVNGACWQAFNLSGNSNSLLIDVNPLSLGIEMMGGIVDKIILRNSTIPISKTKEFTTYADNQTAMKLHIVQGENEFAQDCRSLAKFEIKNIPPMLSGIARVAVTFNLDADGLLTVSAIEKITQSSAKIVVKPSFSLDDQQIKSMLLKSLENSQSDIQKRLLTQTIIDTDHDITIIEKDLNNPQLKIPPSLRKKITNHLIKIKQLIENNPNKENIEQAKEQLIKIVEPLILQKVNNTIQQQIIGSKIE